MADWPSLPAPSYGSGGRGSKPQVRTPMEFEYSQSRPMYTKEKMYWDSPGLIWENMAEADFQTLWTFFKANVGLVVTNFPEPATGTYYSIRFLGNDIPWVWDNYGTRRVGPVPLEEAL